MRAALVVGSGLAGQGGAGGAQGLEPQLCRDAFPVGGRSKAAGREPLHLSKDEWSAVLGDSLGS